MENAWSSTRIVPIGEPAGSDGALVVITDISDRVGAEQARDETENQWRSLVDNAPDYIMLLDREGTIQFLNHPPGGCAGDALVGKTIYEVSSPEDRERLREAIHQVLTTGDCTTFESAAGNAPVYSSHIGPSYKDGQIVGVTSITRDITERRRDEALRTSLTRVLESLAAGKDLADVLGRLLRAVEERSPQMRCAAFLIDEQSSRLKLLAAPGLPEKYEQALDGLDLGIDVGPFGSAVASRERMLVADVRRDPSIQEYRDPLLKLELHGCWVEPILDTRGDVLGVLAFHHPEAREPNDAEIELIEVAERVAELAIERRRAAREDAEREAAIRGLHAITSAHGVGFEEQVRQLLELGCQRFGTEVGIFTRRIGDRFRIEQVHPADDGSLRQGAFVEDEISMCEHAVRSDHPIVFQVRPEQPAHNAVRGKLEAFLATRVLVGDAVHGSLCFLRREPSGRRITEAETDWLELLGRWIGNELEHARTHRDLDQRYRTLYDQLPDAVMLLDPQTGIPAGFNDPAVQLLGYDRDELERMPIYKHDLDYSPSEILAGMQRTVVEGGSEFSTRMRTRSGEVRDLKVTSRPVELSGKTMLQLVLHDITELKSSERVLRESEQRFAHVFRSSPMACLITQLPEGRLIDVNDQFSTTTGYSREEALGMTTMDLGLWQKQETREQVIGELQSSGSVRDFECEFVNKCGEVRTMRVNMELVDLSGERCALTIADDVTDRVRAEQEKERLETMLRHAGKMEALGQLAGGVSHDFNNILTAILGNAEMLEREHERVADNLPPRARDQLRQIRHAGERASALTRQLLAFSRKQVRELVVLQPNRIIAEMQGMMQRLIGEHVILETRLDPTLGCILADVSQIEQLVLNLVVNARDAMPRGGTLGIETANVELEAGDLQDPGAKPGPHVMIRVRDNGCGMNDETVQHIFEPFFTTKPVGQGTGLGLATVYGIVSQAGGTIRVNTEVGQGTAFELLIPRAPRQETTDTRPQPITDVRGDETVLVCEDDEMVRALASEVLRDAGYRVMQAENGREALRLATGYAGPIHLLVTDTVMPEMSGAELAGRLCEQHGETRVLLVSGHTGDLVASQTDADENLEMLAKPFTAATLLQRVRRTLDAEGPRNDES